MKVEKVPDSTYDMIGGLDQQIKEIKEVISAFLFFPIIDLETLKFSCELSFDSSIHICGRLLFGNKT